MLSKCDTIKQLLNIHYQTTYIPEFDKMVRSASPFFNSFGLNHLYYYRLSPLGNYTTFGTHSELFEYSFNQYPQWYESDPCFRCKNLKPGIFIEDIGYDQSFNKILDDIFNRFKLKYTIRVQRKIGDAYECFGFCTKLINRDIKELLINNLPIVNKFIDFFISENKTNINIAKDNEINIIPLVGSFFYEQESSLLDSTKKIELLKYMGLETGECLTEREKEILHFFASGYPARYIAEKLFISVRTVEHHIAEMKLKLQCSSKVELINIAKNSLF